MDIAHIIAGCKRGDRQAQKQVFELYSKGLLVVCVRYVQNTHDAEELLLNGFYKFFATIGQFVYISDAGLTAWIKKIVVNECLMFLRSAKKIQFIDTDDVKGGAVKEEVWYNIGAKEILNEINCMPDGYRIVFSLFVIEGFTHSEIAAMLGISLGTSKSQLMRAKIYLQRLLEKKGIVYEPG